MAFVAAVQNPGKQVPTFGQLYRHGKKTQTQFHCGWKCSYLKGFKEPSPVSFENFGRRKTNVNYPNKLTQAPTAQVPSTQTNLASNTASNPNQYSSKYFMAGRQGCPFVSKAHDQHVLQKKAVVELNCMNPNMSSHPVCQMNSAARRGTPAYYKQTGPDTYEHIHTGYTTDLSFLR